MMNKGKHLTLDERKQIETLLNRKHSFNPLVANLVVTVPPLQKKYLPMSFSSVLLFAALPATTANTGFNVRNIISAVTVPLHDNLKNVISVNSATSFAKSMKLTSALHWKRLRMSAIPVRSVLLPALWKSISMMLFQRTKSTPIHFLNLAPD